MGTPTNTNIHTCAGTIYEFQSDEFDAYARFTIFSNANACTISNNRLWWKTSTSNGTTTRDLNELYKKHAF
jgi:hypothetical protein